MSINSTKLNIKHYIYFIQLRALVLSYLVCTTGGHREHLPVKISFKQSAEISSETYENLHLAQINLENSY